VVEVPESLDDDRVASFRTLVNRAVMGERIADAAERLADLPEGVEPPQRPVLSALVAALVEAMSDHRSDERVMVGGTANLTRFGDGFEVSIQPLLEALEEHVLLLKLLGEASSPATLTVRIGSEVPYEGLGSTSVVATGYGPGAESLANLGVLGPTRMDYPGAMASVRAVAQYLSKILDES
jgi:heat-inducible transcriptional repressor